MIQANIDNLDAAAVSAYPFTASSAGQASDIGIVPGDIIALSIDCTEDIEMPLRLTGVSRTSAGADITFSDSAGVEVAVWHVRSERNDGSLCTGYLIAPSGTLTGHVCYRGSLAQKLIGCGGIDAYPEIASICCHASMRGTCRSISVNGDRHTCDISLNLGNNTEGIWYDGWLEVSVVPPYGKAEGHNGFTELSVVNGAAEAHCDIRDRHLVLRHGITSNLRVVTGTGISIRGVKDV